MATDPLDHFCTLVEAATELEIHPDSLRKLLGSNAIPGAREWAKRWVFDRAALRESTSTYRNTPGRPPDVGVR